MRTKSYLAVHISHPAVKNNIDDASLFIITAKIIRRIFMPKVKELLKTKNLALIALLIALNVVLSRFLSFNVWNLKIGFTFVSLIFAAYFTSPVGAAIVGGAGDLIGALMFPIGAYFPGFTLTAVLEGLCFGFLIYKKTSFPKICISVIANEIIGGLLMNTFWISVLYGSDFKVLFVTRLLTQILPMIVVEILTTQLLFGKSMVVQRVQRAIR